MYAAIHGLRTKEAESHMRDWMACFDFSDQAKDEERLLSQIFASTVPLDYGAKATVSDLLTSLSNDSIKALARIGIRKLARRGGARDGETMLFFAHDVSCRCGLTSPSGSAAR